MPLFSPADFSEEIQGHGGGPPHHQGDHLPASGGNPYITSNEPYFPGHYLGAHKSPCKFSSPGAVCSHCIRSPAGFGGPSQACQLPFDPMQAANAGNQDMGNFWHNEAHSAAANQAFDQQGPVAPWDSRTGYADPHSVGHGPRIARRIARKVYGIQDPEAWTRRAGLSLL